MVSRSAWLKSAVLLLGIAVVGLPVNTLAAYSVLVVLAVLAFTGEVSAPGRLWLAALAVAAVSIVAQSVLAPPRFEEGHNVFLPGGPTRALEQGLPPPVYKQMLAEFDALYPPSVRCKPGVGTCWQDQGYPATLYAFSADGIWHKTTASRSVTALDFTDPVWLHLSFVNSMAYNWYQAAPDLHRADRDRRFWMGLTRWHLAMPWFEMVRLPAAYVGGELCWRGELMWEGANGDYSRWPGDGCRAIEARDAGKQIFGLAIRPGTLAMQLTPPWSVRLLRWAQGGAALAGVIGLLWLLVRVRTRPALFAFGLVALACLVIAADDASFLGGARPFDGGDDGLFYDHVGRTMLQHLLAGDVWGFLQGGENVFYYGGPGLRYFRALEHLVCGESYFGYLSLVLGFPFVVLALFRRFLPADWALALIILFVAVPVGTLFGTAFVNYEKWASHGFADPAAYILFICATLPVIGSAARGPDSRFLSAFFGALLLATGIFMKPIVTPAAAVLLGGAGLAALYQRQWPRLAGLCLGFLPVFSMALHNWVFGHVFVLFSANAQDSNLLVMPPSAYAAAMRELFGLHAGGATRHMLQQFVDWLSGPGETAWTIPLNAAAVGIVAYVVLRGRRFDPWLRLLGASALAQHMVALFYNAATNRYHFLTWFLTMLVVMVWFHDVAIGWLARRCPALSQRFGAHPLAQRLASGLTRLQEVSA